MPEDCPRFAEFLKTEREALKKTLRRYRVRLSKKLGRSVTKQEAEFEFIKTEIWAFSEGFRRRFCKGCPLRKDCEIGKKKPKGRS